MSLTLILYSILLVASLTDLRKGIIPNGLILAGMVLCPWVVGKDVLPNGLIAIGLCAGLLAVLEIYRRCASKRGMGMGDVKLLFIIGLYMGWDAVWILYIAFCLGAVFGLAGMALKRLTRSSRLAFAPFLALASVIVTQGFTPMLALGVIGGADVLESLGVHGWALSGLLPIRAKWSYQRSVRPWRSERMGTTTKKIMKEERGSAMVSVLVLISLLTLILGLLFGLHVAQYRLIKQDSHQVEARYISEAALYVAMDSLEHNPRWRTKGWPLAIATGDTVSIDIEPYGGYLLIRSTAEKKRARYVTRAVVGEKPSQLLRYAVYQWDDRSNLSIAGETNIGGDIVVGFRGTRLESLEGIPFTGSIDGESFPIELIQEPEFFYESFSETQFGFEQLLAFGASRASAWPYEKRTRARQLISNNEIVYFGGDQTFSDADSTLFDRAINLVVEGDIRITGSFAFEPGSAIVAGDSLSLEGDLRLHDTTLYGRNGLSLTDRVSGFGQLLSNHSIHIQDDVYIRYPSTAYISAEEINNGGAIRIENRSVFEGSLVVPKTDVIPDRSRGRIILGDSTLVRGSIVNNLETELHGVLEGNALTYQFYFYRDPSDYINWLFNTDIDVRDRPANFLSPLLSPNNPNLEVVWMEGYGEPKTLGRFLPLTSNLRRGHSEPPKSREPEPQSPQGSSPKKK